MSIINDALKKTQQRLFENQLGKKRPQPPAAHPVSPLLPLSEQPTPVSPTPPIVTTRVSVTTLTIIVCASLVSIGIIIAVLFFLIGQTHTPTYPPTVAQETITSVPTTAQPVRQPSKPAQPQRTTPARTSNAPQKPALVVSGTLIMPDKSVALIGDNIYEVGDSIDGHQITDITIKEVTFLTPTGETIKLRVTGK